VVDTGLSAVTPLGKNLGETWKNIMDNKCAIKNIANKGEVFKKLKC